LGVRLATRKAVMAMSFRASGEASGRSSGAIRATLAAVMDGMNTRSHRRGSLASQPALARLQ